MPDDENHSLILLPDASLAKSTAVADRVLSAMVGEALTLLRQEQTAIRSPKLIIGEYEFSEPDYLQVIRWAEALKLEPRVVIERLFDDGTLFGFGMPGHSPEWTLTRLRNGRFETLFWDRRRLPLREFEWVQGLLITALSFCTKSQPSWKIETLSLPLPELRQLHCRRLGLTAIDLSCVSKLNVLDCRQNDLKTLNLSTVPQLTELDCGVTAISKLTLTEVPRLVKLCCCGTQLTDLDLSGASDLTKLDCHDTQIAELDLSRVHKLEFLQCGWTQIRELDLSSVPELETLACTSTGITELDLSRVPSLMTLDCANTEITELDFSHVPNLESLDCGSTEIRLLDIRSLEHLCYLEYDKDRTRLIQRPDQNF